ncbi:ABC transporter ATP-binding protein [Maledivibacter halophilus]|uniref:Energy-coupling factor transport system ATP-binding protein n=1 Tax=Maledivibacter halophilus TaxID=36842 RepID=A0A1T5L968_9FIRM|nr:energy-coupling factor ABC transporter ATP-binding protein [Maledivibacter halophilus]SKC72490.1 energy-coupling factor transport system ATP-binding protein [Maledivibacter halophilus]
MIDIKEVTYIYNSSGNEGIKDINLKINKGEFVLLCGKSGCGKTTLTRLINGLIPHFYKGELKGDVTIGDMDILDTPMYKIAEKVGSVFQNPRSQFFNVDTNSEIAFGVENLAYPPHEVINRVNKTIYDLKIQNLMGKSIFKLSGGEKQKVAFASVYALSPDVYVLDEPSSNLDAYAIDELRSILFLLKKQGKTLVIAEHRLYYLKDIVDRIIYMEKGRISKAYRMNEFLKISREEKVKKGLRTMDLKNVKVGNKELINEKPIFEIKNLSLKYGKKTIRKNININAAPGDIIGIIGNNGAGKSTLSKTICGLHKDYYGTFLWNGRKISSKERLKLSYMVMQDVNYQLFAETVEEECFLGCKNPNKERIEDTLKELSLYECRKRHPMSLSGGQKQRTAVAVSMLCSKKIIIFDEPTSGLDLDGMLRVGKLIKELSRRQKIIFVVTHDYEFIMKICNRTLYFNDNRKGENFEIIEKPLEELKEIFIGEKTI